MSKTRGLFALSGARILNAVFQLFVFAWAARTFGMPGMGAFFYVQGVARILWLFEFSFYDVMQRQVTKAHDAGDKVELYSNWQTLKPVLALTGVLFVGLNALAGVFIQLTDFRPAWGVIAFFALGGLTVYAQHVFLAFNGFFIGRRMFDRTALTNVGMSVCASSLGAAAIAFGGSVEMYMLAMGVGPLIMAAFNFAQVQREMRREAPEAKFNRGIYKEWWTIGLKHLPNKATTTLSSTVDKPILNSTLGTGGLGSFGSATRIPEAATEAFPFNQVVVPDLVKAFNESPTSFARAIERLTTLGGAAGLAVIAIPCGAALPVLQLMLGPEYHAPMEWAMISMGLTRGLDVFFTGVGIAMWVAGKPERIYPFTFFNAIFSLSLFYPMTLHFGFIGIVVTRLLVHLIEFVPIMWYTKRHVNPVLNLWSWGARSAITFGLGAAFSLAVHAVAISPLGRAHIWLALAVVPVAMFAYVYLIARFRLVDLPSGIARRLRLPVA